MDLAERDKLAVEFRKVFRRPMPESEEEVQKTQAIIDDFLGRIHAEHNFTIARDLAEKAGYKTYPSRIQDYLLRVKGDLSATRFERTSQ